MLPAPLVYSLSSRKLTFYRNGPCKGLCTKTALGLGLGTATTGRKHDDLPTCTFLGGVQGLLLLGILLSPVGSGMMFSFLRSWTGRRS